MLKSRTIATLLLLLLCNIASAQVYQWKDKNGRTILSDSPPPPSVKSRVLESTNNTADGTPPVKTLADKEQAFRQRQQEADAKAEQGARDKEAQQERKSYCDDARRELALLQSGERIAQRDSNGERAYLDDEQRQQKVDSTQRFLDSNCKGL